jgi:hypothetical protein
MDSGKFSSAAVNRVLKDTGQNQAISRVQVLHPASRERVIESNYQAATTGLGYSDEEMAGEVGGSWQTQEFAEFSSIFCLFPNSCGLSRTPACAAGDRAFYVDFRSTDFDSGRVTR